MTAYFTDLHERYRKIEPNLERYAQDILIFDKLKKAYGLPNSKFEAMLNFDNLLDLADVFDALIGRIESLEAEIARLVEPHSP